MKKILDNKQLTSIIIVSLFIINIVLLIFIFVHPKSEPHQPEKIAIEEREKKMEQFIIKQLELNESQVVQMRELRNEFRNYQSQFHRQLRDQNLEIIGQIFEEDVDTAKINQMLTKVQQLHGEAAIKNMRHLMEMKAMCKPEQYPELKKMFIRMNAHWHPEHGKKRRKWRNKRPMP